MNLSWIVVVTGVWIVSVLFQLGDLGTSTIDARTACDREPSGRLLRQRARGLFWVVPFASVVVVGFGVGIDFAGRLFYDLAEPLVALVFVLALAAIASGAVLLVITGLLSDAAVDYRGILAQLRSVEGERRPRDEISGFRRQLTAIDDECRIRERETTMRAAIGYLVTGGIVRLTPVLLGLAVAVAVVFAVHGQNVAQLIVVAFIVFALSGGLALVGSRMFLVAESAWRDVHETQRAHAVRILDDLEHRSTKRNAGLGERVTRALQILREQQA